MVGLSFPYLSGKLIILRESLDSQQKSLQRNMNNKELFLTLEFYS
jgi:hypothetical protein